MDANGNHDLLIVGSGPAGLLLAAEACERGLSVGIIAPDPTARWLPRWSAFEDELPSDVPVRHRWPHSEVRVGNRVIRSARPYVQVDGEALQRQLLDRARQATFLDTTALGRTPQGVSTPGGEVRGRHVVDASGAAQVLSNPGAKATAFQTAFGMEIETDGHPWAPSTALWMDLQALEQVPSFLYAMPTSPTRVFVEETALAARPEVPLDLLERRLLARLERLGVQVRAVHDTEICRIPLDVPMGQQLAFGTAAGMVHPSTGYLLARLFAVAPGFVDALADGRPDRARALTRSAARPLHLLGLDVLTRCDGPELEAFFSTFFAQPDTVTAAFLDRDPTLWKSTSSMLRIFLGAPSDVRRLLVRPILS